VGEDALYFLYQVFGQAWLSDERIPAGWLGSSHCIPSIVAGQGHHRNVSGPRVCSQVLNRLPAIHARKRSVHQDDVGYELESFL
jgi:hypothetical protein